MKRLSDLIGLTDTYPKTNSVPVGNLWNLGGHRDDRGTNRLCPGGETNRAAVMAEMQTLLNWRSVICVE